MRYFVTIGDHTHEVELADGDVRLDGERVGAELATVPGTRMRNLRLNGRSFTVQAEPGGRRGAWRIATGEHRFTVDAVDERTRAIREMSGTAADSAELTISAPMPGMVVRVEVEPGQTVTAGQGVIVVEAMKMENELKAPADGTVAEIRVSAGETVEKGAILIVLE